METPQRRRSRSRSRGSNSSEKKRRTMKTPSPKKFATPSRSSKRIAGLPRLREIELGKSGSSYKKKTNIPAEEYDINLRDVLNYKDDHTGKDELRAKMYRRINKIKDDITFFVEDKFERGPQMVTIPTGDERHTFLVNITPAGIFVADWCRRCIHEHTLRFAHYIHLMDKLQKTYGLDIMFYPIDISLYETCDAFAERSGGGGCAKYAYEWYEMHKEMLH